MYSIENWRMTVRNFKSDIVIISWQNMPVGMAALCPHLHFPSSKGYSSSHEIQKMAVGGYSALPVSRRYTWTLKTSNKVESSRRAIALKKDNISAKYDMFQISEKLIN